MKNNKDMIFESTTTNPMKGVGETLIRKRSRTLRRLKEYLLYRKLRSLVSPPNTYENEIQSTNMDEEEIKSADRTGDEGVEACKSSECDDDVDVDYGEDDDDDEWEFVPSVKLKRMDTSLLISAVVLKDVALSSKLFQLLEEQKLDIVFANQYRTETKVSHTIQVNLHSENEMVAFKERLYLWAGKKNM
ncbi:hypothetical protein QJS04_geneDACA000267 [Acorus gramineus]|uniref:Uncharacterized protein n=1 Tax=Acorus gramineus TaxID=55184 RepID=A0AAV9AP11_ACOGR|nr:hypothetical protein QJS04_geneDACA000267 [Acorus gramineus]